MPPDCKSIQDKLAFIKENYCSNDEQVEYRDGKFYVSKISKADKAILQKARQDLKKLSKNVDKIQILIDKYKPKEFNPFQQVSKGSFTYDWD